MRNQTYAIRRIAPQRIYAQAAGLGFIAGVRALVGPMVLSHHLANDHQERAANPFLSQFASPLMANLLKALVAGELVIDKLPFVPPRTDPPLLLTRASSGAVAGAMACAAHKENPILGAIIGGAAAVLGAHFGYTARTTLSESLGVHQALIGVLEDALVISGGAALMHLTDGAA